MTGKQLFALAKKHGTPLVVIDHDVIRRNYATFRKRLPKVQAYYAVKANPASEIIETLYKAGASFDVASFPEFLLVHQFIKHLPSKERQDFIWDKSFTPIRSSPSKSCKLSISTSRSSRMTTTTNCARSGGMPERRARAVVACL